MAGSFNKNKLFDYIIKLVLIIFGAWFGFAVPFFVFIFSGFNLILILIVSMLIGAGLITFLQYKKIPYYKFVNIFLIGYITGVVFQFLILVFRGWSNFFG